MLLRRFTTRDESGFRIVPALRERVLFATHNILRDPPFSRLDMVSCRNLLIYLERDVQREILQMFHFALRPDGYLFLGSSETADASARLFTAVDKKHRIYRANASVRSPRTPPSFPLGGVQPRGAAPAAAPSGKRTDIAGLHQQLLEDYSPPSVLVRADGEILHSSRADSFLQFAAGVPSQQVGGAAARAACGGACGDVPGDAGARDDALIDRQAVAPVAARRRRRSRCSRCSTRSGRRRCCWCCSMKTADASAGAASDGEGGGAQHPMVAQLEAEVAAQGRQLQRVIEQNETAVEDLRASNEELQAINEELRSATEELETSKEELQSTNEELITVNAELKSKVEEMAEINDDLHNLIASSDIATVFVDRDMRIKRFTPAATRIFSIIADDVGRSLLDITPPAGLRRPGQRCQPTPSPRCAPSSARSAATGRWYLVRMLPYRTGEDRIDGAVLTFVDITTRRRDESALGHRPRAHAADRRQHARLRDHDHGRGRRASPAGAPAPNGCSATPRTRCSASRSTPSSRPRTATAGMPQTRDAPGARERAAPTTTAGTCARMARACTSAA